MLTLKNLRIYRKYYQENEADKPQTTLFSRTALESPLKSKHDIKFFELIRNEITVGMMSEC